MTIDTPESTALLGAVPVVDLPGLDLPDEPTSTRDRAGRIDAALNRVFASRSLWLLPIVALQAILTLRLSKPLGTISGSTVADALLAMAATVFVYLAARRIFSIGAAVIGAAVFAANPAVLVTGHTATAYALTVLIVAAAFYAATRATDAWSFAIVAGLLLVAASTERYAALLFAPSLLVIVAVANGRDPGHRRAAAALGITMATILAAGAIAGVTGSHSDWTDLWNTTLHPHSLDGSPSAFLRSVWTAIGPLTLAGIVAIVAVRRRLVVTVVLAMTTLIPIAANAWLGDPVSIRSDLALGLVFLAPLVGVVGAALVRPGRWLHLRAPVALIGVVLILSSGIGTPTANAHHSLAARYTVVARVPFNPAIPRSYRSSSLLESPR